ncbi:hypothetical protein FNW02_37275 [Komarekiella sp. 'clone 1']|uniref:Uncharacterized protein n=1 Tax=Komarekiella delphini-convector SJRDD-AB1 TaxID=2593771 RepID=A0AA40VVT9_9NOST|nr:hypothetical protein [Komarekiella delphini-convector]MBD6621200.1 hypothetical protein [Komarekiella delphini-convector SJRDD-AB1]
MIEPKTLIKGKLYIFRGVQLRYQHPSSCAVQARYVFTNSKGQRRELGAQIIRRELHSIEEFAEN